MHPFKGGKYVDEGTYGCVFAPPITCQHQKGLKHKNPHFYKGTVGKLFANQNEFETELEALRTIQELDPDNTFTVSLQGSCRAHVNYSSEVRGASGKCRDLATRLDSPNHQVILENGGRSLKAWTLQYRDKPESFVRMFRKLGPVLNGLAKMTDRRLVHGDIKPANMLFNNKKISLIDFGLSSAHDQVFQKENAHILKHHYPYFPIEFKAFLSHGIPSHSWTVKDAMKGLDDNLNFIVHWKEAYEHLGVLWVSDLEAFVSKLSSVSEAKRKTTFNSFLSSFDTYSLGISLLEVYSGLGLVNRKRYAGMKTQASLEIIRTFLAKLIIPNPFTRYTIHQALHHYNRIVKLL